MKLEEFQKLIGYFVEESQEYLDIIYNRILHLQNTIDHREELNALFRVTFSLKGGAAMLGFTSLQKIVYRLEDCLQLLRYPIIADDPLQLLFLDVYHAIKRLILEIKTPEGLTAQKVADITCNIDAIFTVINSHLLFLIDKSNYKNKITNTDSCLTWGYDIPLKLILLDTKNFLCRTFADYFEGLPNVEIFNGTIEELSFFDCVVTAASCLSAANNSIDAAVIRFFGEDVEQLLQKRIQEEYLGDQPIGTSLIVETNHPLHPFIAHVPTLRMQMSMAGKDHVYQGLWSTLLAIRQHNKLYCNYLQKQINIVAVPGLGTGLGCVPIDEVARQMSMAYQNFLFSFTPWQREFQSLLTIA
ncbi:Hpt domain-containing protein [Sphaerospermopsis aphanizomenoides BCCUSP55]|uniref:Hpt domain-containing protein n=1 Tax=Sphaerospermopsis aphanizomenoides TaxID=459663 RepID=UPI0019042D87|nr:Hpt domain-containing protein [Sphaerospermopsis aphanizomenoides]MBK1989682.1 Hpt domain-containing protein [Sphaerospermopsis aphanizomenoides BCCUSP55]